VAQAWGACSLSVQTFAILTISLLSWHLRDGIYGKSIHSPYGELFSGFDFVFLPDGLVSSDSFCFRWVRPLATTRDFLL
jgi:hypothetical protein